MKWASLETDRDLADDEPERQRAEHTGQRPLPDDRKRTLVELSQIVEAVLNARGNRRGVSGQELEPA